MRSGVGIDLLEIERMERALRHYPRLAARVFAAAGRDYAAARAAAAGRRGEVSLTHSRDFAAAVAIVETA